MLKKIMIYVLLGLAGVFVLLQLVPYGRQHTNPPVVSEPPWGSPEARQVAQRACFDCHSNETVWPWYSNIAPISWLIQRDVEEGRAKLNFSEWGVSQGEGEWGEAEEGGEGVREIARVVQRGFMPPPYYVLLHPQARLSAQEKQMLIQGLPTAVATNR